VRHHLLLAISRLSHANITHGLTLSLTLAACQGNKFETAAMAPSDGGTPATARAPGSRFTQQELDASKVTLAHGEAATGLAAAQPSADPESQVRAPAADNDSEPKNGVEVDPEPQALPEPLRLDPTPDTESAVPGVMDAGLSAGSTGDAGVAASATQPGGGPDTLGDPTATTPPSSAAPESPGTVECEGATYQQVCWYLGEPDDSCTQTCEDHGGVDDGMLALVGTSAQGGSLDHCQAVMDLLGVHQTILDGFRMEGAGVGCHL
jgi:hypothetical protein